MLVVMGILTVLFGAVLLVGRGVLEAVKVRATENMLAQVSTAIKAFGNEDPYKAVPRAAERYGAFPPDDLMAYTPGSRFGNPPVDIQMPNLMPGGIGGYVRISPSSGQVVSPVSDHLPSANYVPYGATKALVWALETTPASRELLDGVPGQFKVVAPTAEDFFDLNGNGSFDPAVDREVTYLVDVWGRPIEYYAVANLHKEESPSAHGWVSQRLVQANSRRPVVLSYGLDGELQIAADKTLEHQYLDNVLGGQASPGQPVFDSPYNEDDLVGGGGAKERLQTILVP